MTLEIIVVSARQALRDAGAPNVGVHVVRPGDHVQVLFDMPVTAEIADKVAAVLKEEHPGLAVEIVRPGHDA